MLVTVDDEKSNDDIESNVELLRDTSQIDLTTQINLWKQTIYFRRNWIRDQTTADIIQQFSGYCNPILVRLFMTHHLIFLNIFISMTGIRGNTNFNADRFTSCCTMSISAFTRQIDFNTCLHHW